MYFYFFAEIKSNIKREQLKLLHDAGFVVLQPGIESISDGVLQVMNKGNRGIRHVELLRNLFELGITVIWHMLGGFPGEKNEYFQELADLIPLVHHLAPPGQFINILFVRYNEYWLHQEKHGIHLRPGDYYYLVYPGKEKFIRDSAFMFRHVEDDRHKMQENIILRSPEHKLVAERFSIWAKHWKISAPRFNFSDDGRKLELMDMRSCAVKLMDTLTGLERSVCLGCREVVKKERLLQKMAEEYTVKPDEVAAVVEKLVGLKYILEIRDELLFLPTLLNSAKHPTVEQRAMTIYYSMIRDGV